MCDILIKNVVFVVMMDDVLCELCDVDIFVFDGVIVEIGEGLIVDVEVIDVKGFLVVSGLVNIYYYLF